MTDYQRNLLDTNLNKFKDFIEFVKFTYAHDIEFEMDEWEDCLLYTSDAADE